jgi:hypothetical protein
MDARRHRELSAKGGRASGEVKRTRAINQLFCNELLDVIFESFDVDFEDFDVDFEDFAADFNLDFFAELSADTESELREKSEA